MKKNGNKKKGFTLIELIVVIAILVALMLILVPKLTGFTNDATKTANAANARAIYTALKASETATETGMYDAKDNTKYPQVTVCYDDGKNEVKAYVSFWGDAAVKVDTGCVVTKDSAGKVSSVKYGTNNVGTYPAE